MKYEGETLENYESTITFYFFTSLIVIIGSSILILIFAKYWKKSIAFGIIIPTFVALIYLFNFGTNYLDNFSYNNLFNKNQWIHSEIKPLKMAVTLVKKHDLVGMTKEQIIGKLGLGKDNLKKSNTGYESIIYIAQEANQDKSHELKVRDYWKMIVNLKDDKVVSVELFHPFIKN